MKQENKTPEHIALSLLLYSFIIAMCVFALFRAFNIGIFANGYISIETSEVMYYAISMVFYTYEGFLMLKILTNLRWYCCLPIACCYTVLANLIGNRTIIMLLDLVYAFSIPFIFNKDKDKSIKHSTLYFVGVCIYQFIMSFGRYDVTTLGKYDIGYAVLSFIDYRIFILIILLNKLRRTKTNG